MRHLKGGEIRGALAVGRKRPALVNLNLSEIRWSGYQCQFIRYKEQTSELNYLGTLPSVLVPTELVPLTLSSIPIELRKLAANPQHDQNLKLWEINYLGFFLPMVDKLSISISSPRARPGVITEWKTLHTCAAWNRASTPASRKISADAQVLRQPTPRLSLGSSARIYPLKRAHWLQVVGRMTSTDRGGQTLLQRPEGSVAVLCRAGWHFAS